MGTLEGYDIGLISLNFDVFFLIIIIYSSRLACKALRMILHTHPTVSSGCCLEEEDYGVYLPGPVD